MSINREEWKRYAQEFLYVETKTPLAYLLGFPDTVTQADLDHIHSLIKGVGDGGELEYRQQIGPTYGNWIQTEATCSVSFFLISRNQYRDWSHFRLKPTPVKKRVPLCREDLPNLFVVRSRARLIQFLPVFVTIEAIKIDDRRVTFNDLFEEEFQWQRIGESQWNEFWKEVEQ